MKILLLGSEGQLGQAISRLNWPDAFTLTAPPHHELDLSVPLAIESAFKQDEWDLVINAAAYTAVDQAESEPEAAAAVNRDAPAVLASCCAKTVTPLLHVSTDYVFDGRKRSPYREDDPISPLGVYGRTKAEGEAVVRTVLPRHLILRTSWLFSATGRNFLTTMLRLGRDRDELRIVDDQQGNPTAASDLADAIRQLAVMLAERGELDWGTYHFCGQGDTTWFGFAEAIFAASADMSGPQPRLTRISTDQFPTPARRPADSRLECTRIKARLGITPPRWLPACHATVAEVLGQQKETAP